MSDSIAPKEETKIEDKPVVEEKKTEVDYAKAAEDYRADMFKFKDRAKSLESELAKMRSESEAVERQNLERNEEWKELYEREKLAKDKAVTDLVDKTDKYIKSGKINAVVQQLGGFKKSEYSKFIEANNIDINENGTFSDESLQKEVDRVRQLYPELLKTHKATSTMPSNESVTHSPAPVSLGKMSKDQLLAQYSKVNKK